MEDLLLPLAAALTVTVLAYLAFGTAIAFLSDRAIRRKIRRSGYIE